MNQFHFTEYIMCARDAKIGKQPKTEQKIRLKTLTKTAKIYNSQEQNSLLNFRMKNAAVWFKPLPNQREYKTHLQLTSLMI